MNILGENLEPSSGSQVRPGNSRLQSVALAPSMYRPKREFPTDPELRPWLLNGLCRRVQGPPLVGKLGPPTLPLFQEQRGPDDIEDGKDHTTDIPAGLVGLGARKQRRLSSRKEAQRARPVSPPVPTQQGCNRCAFPGPGAKSTRAALDGSDPLLQPSIWFPAGWSPESSSQTAGGQQASSVACTVSHGL